MTLFGDILGNLTTPPIGRSRRVSSNEQPNWNDGNMDFSSLLPGSTLEVPVLSGPGIITHIWMTSHAGLIEDLNCLSLRRAVCLLGQAGLKAGPHGSGWIVRQQPEPGSRVEPGSMCEFWAEPDSSRAREESLRRKELTGESGAGAWAAAR